MTNDPSITAWGWAVITSNNKVIDAGCVKTEPSPKKLNIRKGDDRVRRISEINYVLKYLIEKYNVKFILSELPHGSQSANAAIMIGITAGMAQTISDFTRVGIEWYSEGDCKKHLIGVRSAGKQVIIDKIKTLYEVPWPGTKASNEAVADAIAVYHLARSQSNSLKLLSHA